MLAGVLYRPEGTGPHPAVALVLGSGPTDRSYGGVATALGRHFARAGFACLVNLSDTAVPLPGPASAALLLASGPTPGGQLPPDTAVWLRTT